LADAMQRRSGKRLVAITFDDGFRDNYSHAAPMLDWYDLPATFYFSTTQLSEDHVYWWDVLQAVILEHETLPVNLDIEVAGIQMKFRFYSDQVITPKLAHEIRAWSYSLPVPNERVALFLQLWHQIRPLPMGISSGQWMPFAHGRL